MKFIISFFMAISIAFLPVPSKSEELTEQEKIIIGVGLGLAIIAGCSIFGCGSDDTELSEREAEEKFGRYLRKKFSNLSDRKKSKIMNTDESFLRWVNDQRNIKARWETATSLLGDATIIASSGAASAMGFVGVSGVIDIGDLARIVVNTESYLRKKIKNWRLN